MKNNKHKIILFKTFLIYFLFTFALPSVAQNKKLIQVIIDNSGILHDEKDPQGKTSFDAFVMDFLNTLAVKHRRERDSTTIRITSAVENPRVVWMGSASNFSREGVKSNDIKNLFVNKTGCNDISTALEDASITMSIKSAKINILYLITSGVHSGKDCTDMTQDDYVKLLEALDKNFAEKVKEYSSKFDKFSIQFLTSAQRRLFYNALTDNTFQKNLESQGQDPLIFESDD